MSTLSAVWPSLLDVAKRTDPDGKIATIVEILNQVNPVLDDMPWVEGNLPTGHRTTIRTGLPTPTWRKLYGGVQPTKSTTTQVTDTCGMLEAYAEVDKALADLNGNTAAFRMSEERAHIEGMSQEFASTLWYGNESTEPEAFTGFSPRYYDISLSQGNIITGLTPSAAFPGGTVAPDGAAENTSLWLIGWGENTIHGIHPKGSTAGLKMEDKGQVTVESASDTSYGQGRFEAYRTHYRWDCGLTVRDWRYAVRIALNAEDFLMDASTGVELTNMMIMALELIPSLSNCRPVFYGNRSVLTTLRGHMLKKATNMLTWETLAGKHVTMFDGVPVKRSDALINTEGTTAGDAPIA